jgi:hypothetical protein
VKFAEVLPYLEAGRQAQANNQHGPKYRLHEGELQYLSSGGWVHTIEGLGWFLRASWEVIEEPAPAKPARCDSCAVLNASWELARKREEDLRGEVARLTRERDGLKGAYDGLRAVAENNADILKKIEAVVKAHS